MKDVSWIAQNCILSQKWHPERNISIFIFHWVPRSAEPCVWHNNVFIIIISDNRVATVYTYPVCNIVELEKYTYQDYLEVCRKK